MEVSSRRLAPMPSLVWVHSVENLGGRAVEDVHGRHLYVSLGDGRHPLSA
jgi:hypothetical protein